MCWTARVFVSLKGLYPDIAVYMYRNNGSNSTNSTDIVCAAFHPYAEIIIHANFHMQQLDTMSAGV